MSSGEADGRRWSIRSLDGKRRCAVDGCAWEVIGDERCQRHGGHPVISVLMDEWGAATETYADEAAWARWRSSDSGT